jgi:hypothetical protein
MSTSLCLHSFVHSSLQLLLLQATAVQNSGISATAQSDVAAVEVAGNMCNLNKKSFAAGLQPHDSTSSTE